tara:strand:- start:68 stop:478 length:411 start_codon:yes stop_codon:yes gene_type:complete
MNKIVRNVLAVITGIILGSVVNMGIIMLQGYFIALPEGVDVTNTESLQSSMHLFGPKHFIFPFLAHAIGTLVGAYLSARIAASHKMKFALGIGIFFLIGGISMVFMMPAPVWFVVLDLSVAYIPTGWLGGRLATKP